ncbi:MAG: LptA/OstA family protein [Verrucomicrobiota bacterium]
MNDSPKSRSLPKGPKTLLALFAMVSAGLAPLDAQTAPNTVGLPNAEVPAVPTELRSEKLEMTSTDEETRAIATGSVVLTGTNLRITCDRLEIVATRIGDKNETVGTLEKFKYLLATGRVKIIQDDREATCGRAEVFPREEKVVLTEEPVIIDKSTDFVAAGERITLLRGQREVLVDLPRFTGPPIKDLGGDAKDQPKK